MQRRYLSGSGLHVEDHGGNGPPAVLVHGLGGSAMNWRLVAPRLSERMRVIAPDLPGHGLSAPADTHDLDAHRRAILEVIDQVGAPVVLVGNSMGGLVCERLAAASPHLVHGLVLVSPATPPPRPIRPPAPMLAARLFAQSLPVVGAPVTRAAVMRWTPREQVEETLGLVMADPTRLPAYMVDAAVDLATRRRTMPWAARAFAESAASVRRAFLDRSGFRRMIDGIVSPTTLIYGSEDRIVPPVGLRWLRHRRPDWRSLELDGVGHTPMFERPDIVIHETVRLAG